MKTLKITEETHNLLVSYGNKNETFDEIIRRLFQERKKR